MAAGLQRSTTSFRRQGSSGLIWDDKNLSGDLSNFRHKDNKDKNDLRPSEMQRSRLEGGAGGGGRLYRTVKEAPPVLDPPSPKVSGCGLCGFFGKPDAAAAPARKPKSNKRKS